MTCLIQQTVTIGTTQIPCITNKCIEKTKTSTANLNIDNTIIAINKSEATLVQLTRRMSLLLYLTEHNEKISIATFEHNINTLHHNQKCKKILAQPHGW